MMQTMSTQITYNIQPSMKQSVGLQKNRDKLISEVVDSSLSCFGNPFKQYVYSKLDKKYQIKKREIPSRISDFADALEDIFGAGAKLIEMRIIQDLHEKAQGFVYVPSGDDLVFTEYLENLRQFP